MYMVVLKISPNRSINIFYKVALIQSANAIRICRQIRV